MVISLIHPSRGRAEKSCDNTMEWIRNSGLESVEIIVSIDDNDELGHKYKVLYNQSFCGGVVTRNKYNFYGIESQNSSVVEATNKAAAHCTGDILIYLSDDFKAPENWGQLILKEFEGVTEPMLLKVDDCLQKFDVPVLTIPIMNRALYERLGYFWHPEYKSMFVDQHLFEVVKKNGWLKLAPHLKFPHEHVSIGKAPDDETYRNSAKNWEQGKALFAKHKSLGFPV